MTKKPRRTMADVTSGLRDMSPPEPVAAPVPEADPELALEAPKIHATTRSRENVSTTNSKPRGFNVRKERIEKPHQSVYAHPAVFRELRMIALKEGVKPQDLYREGLRHVFSERGLDFDALDRGEEV